MTQTLTQGEATSAASRMLYAASLSGQRILGVERPRDARGGRSAEKAGNELPGAAQPRHVDSGLDAEPVEQVEHVFTGDVARRAPGIRTAAESGDGAVESRDPELQRRVHVRQRLAVGIVKMSRLFGDRHRIGNGRNELLRPGGCTGTDGVSERDLVTPHRFERGRDVADALGSDFAFVRAVQHAGDVAANANAMRPGRGE